MDIRLKQRLVGAVVLVALGVIFIPMVLQPPEQVQGPDTDIPAQPTGDFKDRLATALPAPAPVPDQPPRQVMAPPDAPPPAASTPATDVAPAVDAPPVTAELSNAEAEVPVPVKASAAPAGPGAWVVQVGVFSQEVNAQALAKTLRAKGHTTFVERFAGKTSPNFRVRLGPFKDRASADALQARLKREDKLAAMVKSYP
jgi:DedD protein